MDDGDFPRGPLRPGSPVRYSPPGWNFYRGPEKEKRNLTFLQKKLILFNNGKNRFPQHSIDPGGDHPVDISAFFSAGFRSRRPLPNIRPGLPPQGFRRERAGFFKVFEDHTQSHSFLHPEMKRLGRNIIVTVFAMERTCSLVSRR